MPRIGAEVVCPVSATKVDENAARVIAFFVVLIAVVIFYYPAWPVALFLAADFASRAFFGGRLSLLKIIAVSLLKMAGSSAKPTDAEPKKFAAFTGMLFSLFMALFIAFGYYTAFKIIGIILIICALLESLLAFCVGCLVYSYFVLPFKSRQI